MAKLSHLNMDDWKISLPFGDSFLVAVRNSFLEDDPP